MSPDLAPVPTIPSKGPETERRAHRRYPIALNLRYRLIARSQSDHAFMGQTCDLSSGGLLFRAGEELPTDEPVELSIHWPFLLEGRCRLQLVIFGHVVRSGQAGTAVSIQRHEFRTLGLSPWRKSLLEGMQYAVV